jgi:heat shock protein HslJ
MLRVSAAVVVALALTTGCRTAPALQTPATWAGTLPCADCPGRRVTLTLQPDSTWRMRTVYVEAEAGRDRAVTDAGRWSRSTDGRRLALVDDREVMLLEVVAADRLRLLDREGRPIATTHNVELALAPAVDPIDAGAALEDTRWDLVWVAGAAAPDPSRPAWIRLSTTDGRAAGSGGCNRMSGTYRAGADSLAFGPMAMTRMACPGLGDQETAFVRALEATRRHAVRGDTLELLDDAGRAVARLARGAAGER